MKRSKNSGMSSRTYSVLSYERGWPSRELMKEPIDAQWIKRDELQAMKDKMAQDILKMKDSF